MRRMGISIFAALTLSLVSVPPPSEAQSPATPQTRSPQRPTTTPVQDLPNWGREVWERLAPVAAQAGLRPTPRVLVTPKPYPGAWYHGSWIEVSEGMLQLLDGDGGEMAFVVAHESGHGLQRQNPAGTLVLHDLLQRLYYVRNPLRKRGEVTPKETETLADLWGFCLMAAAGYNFTRAYAFFGRLQGLSGTAWDRWGQGQGLAKEAKIWKDVHAGDAHRISYLHRAAEHGLPQQCAKARR